MKFPWFNNHESHLVRCNSLGKKCMKTGKKGIPCSHATFHKPKKMGGTVSCVLPEKCNHLCRISRCVLKGNS